MPKYEHVFLARQDVSQQQVDTMTQEYKDIITEAGGSIGRVEYWGLKNLAYKIKKNRKAHYTHLNIDAPHEAVAEMERRMGLSNDVLRFITIRVEEHETEPSIQMKKGSDREDRRGPGGGGGFRGGGGGRGGPREGGRDGGRDGRDGGGRGGPRPGGEASTFRARPQATDHAEER